MKCGGQACAFSQNFTVAFYRFYSLDFFFSNRTVRTIINMNLKMLPPRHEHYMEKRHKRIEKCVKRRCVCAHCALILLVRARVCVCASVCACAWKRRIADDYYDVRLLCIKLIACCLSFSSFRNINFAKSIPTIDAYLLSNAS